MRLTASLFTVLLGDFIAIKYYRKKPRCEVTLVDNVYESKKVGIILQGPPVYVNKFTINTLRFYREKYPESVIVISVWSDVQSHFVDEVEALGIKVLINKKPSPGINNINLQIKSTSAAIQYLQKSCDYILKTRSDQRCDCENDFLGHFQNLQKIFPMEERSLEKRLIVSNLRMSSDRFYGITDFLMFGTSKDMELYWCIPFDSKVQSDYRREKDMRFFIRTEISEGYLVSNFCSNVGYNCDWTELDSQQFLARFFCIVNRNEIGHFWYKYHWQFDNFLRRDDQISFISELSFSAWVEYYLREKSSINTMKQQ